MTPGQARIGGSAPVQGPASLTPRQWQVLRLLALGLTFGEAAGRLSLSRETVKRHAQDIHASLRVSSTIEALGAVGWLVVPAAEWRLAA